MVGDQPQLIKFWKLAMWLVTEHILNVLIVLVFVVALAALFLNDHFERAGASSEQLKSGKWWLRSLAFSIVALMRKSVIITTICLAGMMVLGILIVVVTGTSDTINRSIKDMPVATLHQLCELKEVCLKFHQATQDCATAGEIKSCQIIKVGSVNYSIANYGCVEVSGVYQVNADKVPNGLQCLLGKLR